MFSQDFPSHQDTIACFSCNGAENASYLKSGYFQKFINSELSIINDPTVKLFGKIYPTSSCIWTNMHQLFMDIKRNFFLVKGLATENTDCFKNQSNIDSENLRMDILKTFHIFSAGLQKLRTTTTTMICHNASKENNHLKFVILQIIKEIKNLLLFVGRISCIPDINNVKDFSSDTSRSALSFYHYCHLCLDIWYNSIAILYTLHLLIPTNFDEVFCDFIEQPSPFLQLLSLSIYDLSFLALNRYKDSQMYSNSPFLCTCFSEFWIMIINMIDKSNFCFENISFWNTYLSILQIIVKNISSKSLNGELSIDTFSMSNIHLHIQNPIEACFWLVSHIAPLYKYSTLGYFYEYEKAKNGYVVAKYLVHNLLSSSSETSEKCLRNTLSYCIQLVKLWEPAGDILLPLTDFYIKKIDGTFSIQSIDLSYLFKDSLSWFNYMNNISNFTSLGKESSFDNFLCILNTQLKLDVDHSLWRSLKGRIYSKFIPKKIKELSEVGLQNSFSLFHIIVLSGQLEIINKVCEVASLIESLANSRKQIISWKALYVLLYICQEKKYSAEKVVTLISKFFNSVCSDYAKISRDSTHKSNLMNLLLVYIDNMNELFKRNNNLNLAEYQLICSGFKELLPACGITEGNYILSIIFNILQRIQEIIEACKVTNETECVSILQRISDNIYPSIESIAVMDTAPSIISRIAGTLTKLTHDFSSLINFMPLHYQEIFMNFACKETINSNITCQYVCFVLDYPELIEDLKVKLADLDVFLFQAWLKCVIYTNTKNEYIQELTQKILQSTAVSEMFPNVKSLDFRTDDHVLLTIKLFYHIAVDFNKSNLQEKIKMAQKFHKYFKIYVSLVLNKIKKHKDGPSLIHVYKLTSHLIEHCSPVLHFHVSSEHLLLQILDQTVYPQILFPKDKALQSLVSCSIKEYLPHFMKGLLKLDYRKDKSIEREIRDIFICYISMFPATSNPLTKLVIDSVSRKPEALTLDAYNFILEVLKCCLLSKNIEKPTSIFEFYYEIFRFTPSAYKKEIASVLLQCAMEIYMKQNDSLADFLKHLIKKVLIDFKDKVPLNQSTDILIPIIQWFIQEKIQWAVLRGFGILDMFVEYLPQVVFKTVPFLTKSIETLEHSRGVGEDMLLRNGFKNFIDKLQRKLAK